MNRPPKTRRLPRRLSHSILVRLLGFVWLFAATLLIAVGSVLGLLGVGGHLLVRARPAAATNITYDPSTIAVAALAPLGLGCLLFFWFWIRARRSGR